MKDYLSLLRYTKHYKKNFVFYFLSIIASVLFGLFSLGMLFPFLKIIFDADKLVTAQPSLKASSESLLQYLEYIISTFIVKHGPVKTLTGICIFIVISIFLKNFFVYLSYRFLTPIRYGISYHLRKDVFTHILKLPIGYFTEQRKGDLLSRLSNDMYEIEAALSSTLEGFFKEPITIIVYLSSLFILSAKLTLVLFIILPIGGFIIGRVSRSLRKQSNIAAQAVSTGVSILEETLSGLRIIKGFNAEKNVLDQFQKNNDDQYHAKNKMNFRKDLASPISEVMGVLILSMILWIGGSMILENKNIGIQAASFIVYLGIFSQIINPAKSLSTAFYNMQKGRAALSRVEEIINTPTTIANNHINKKLESFTHSIEFKNVSFYYGDKQILKDISLTIEKGKSVAFVGSSGAGKSTLVDLVPRFHDVSTGELLIDGMNIKDYNIESIRNQISIVTQEPILFNDSIENNIKLGVLDASDAAVQQAARVANAYDFISKKPQQFKTNIGDRGSKLSGGERQRMTIARAILKNAPILILDEATSSLDTESERLVQDAINKMMENRTTIVIAHRLSTIRHADEIIVLNKGEVAERGTHDSLIQQNGIYKRLVDMQELK